MHIAIDARIINSSTGRYVERLVTHLQDIDTTNRYSILVRKKDKNFWTPKNNNFSIVVADFSDYSFGEQVGFKKLLTKLNPDLVHFCMPQQPILYKGTTVTTMHDLTLLKTYNSDKNWLMFRAKQLVGRYVFKRIAKTNKHILTPTEYTKHEYMDFAHIPENKVTVTYEAADVFIDKLRPYQHPFKEFLLYVGQQSDYKNIKRLGDAHQALLKQHPDLGLVLVGRKNASALKNEAYFESKNYKNIHFTGFIEDDQRDWLYTHANAYVFPSLMEGFGLPGLEAMGYGAPVVSSNATCLPEVYGDAAHYFNPEQTDDITKAINEVLSDEELRTRLIENGLNQIKKYSWKKMAEQTHAVYLKVLKEN
ncbi:MAG: glycosyltransferase family 1 protein [Candidatus Saccharibacteria bacterium]